MVWVDAGRVDVWCWDGIDQQCSSSSNYRKAHLLIVDKGKRERHNTYIAPQAATAAAAALYVTDKGGLQPIGCRLSPHTWVCNQIATCSSGLPFNSLYPCNPCTVITWITSHLPTQRTGRLSWPGWLTYSRHLLRCGMAAYLTRLSDIRNVVHVVLR